MTRRQPGTPDPLHLAAARLRPPAAPADDDEDWDAVIARAKMQAAWPRAASPPPSPPPRDAWSEMAATPPPLPAPRGPTFEKVHAKLDALLLGGMKKPAVLPPAFTARRRVDEDRAT